MLPPRTGATFPPCSGPCFPPCHRAIMSHRSRYSDLDSESFRHMVTPLFGQDDVIPAYAYPSHAFAKGLPFRRMVTPLMACIERDSCCFFLSFAPSIKGYGSKSNSNGTSKTDLTSSSGWLLHQGHRPADRYQPAYRQKISAAHPPGGPGEPGAYYRQ